MNPADSAAKKKRRTSGHHEVMGGHDDVKLPSERSFGLVFTAAFALFAVWWYFRRDDEIAALVSLAVSAGFLGVTFTAPAILRPLNILWLKFGLLLSKIVNPVVMGLLFFTVITPIGLILRARGKDLLRMKRDPSAASYWIPKSEADPETSSMSNQF
jgi:hypothetical protein